MGVGGVWDSVPLTGRGVLNLKIPDQIAWGEWAYFTSVNILHKWFFCFLSVIIYPDVVKRGDREKIDMFSGFLSSRLLGNS